MAHGEGSLVYSLMAAAWLWPHIERAWVRMERENIPVGIPFRISITLVLGSALWPLVSPITSTLLWFCCCCCCSLKVFLKPNCQCEERVRRYEGQRGALSQDAWGNSFPVFKWGMGPPWHRICWYLGVGSPRFQLVSSGFMLLMNYPVSGDLWEWPEGLQGTCVQVQSCELRVGARGLWSDTS